VISGSFERPFLFTFLPNTRHQSSTWTTGVHFIITPGDCDWTGLGFGLLRDRLAGKANASEISFSSHSRELGGFGLTWPGGNGAKIGHLHWRSVWLSFFLFSWENDNHELEAFWVAFFPLPFTNCRFSRLLEYFMSPFSTLHEGERTSSNVYRTLLSVTLCTTFTYPHYTQPFESQRCLDTGYPLYLYLFVHLLHHDRLTLWCIRSEGRGDGRNTKTF